MMVEGQSLVTSSGREETDDGQVVKLPFTSLPLLFLATPDPGGRNSGSHSTDEETKVQRSFRPTPHFWDVASGIVLMLGEWVVAFSREGIPQPPAECGDANKGPLAAMKHPEFNPDLTPLCLSFPNCQLEITMSTSSGCCELNLLIVRCLRRHANSFLLPPLPLADPSLPGLMGGREAKMCLHFGRLTLPPILSPTQTGPWEVPAGPQAAPHSRAGSLGLAPTAPTSEDTHRHVSRPAQGWLLFNY